MKLNMNEISPKDPRLSVFLTNMEDRGLDNYRKRVYMSALTADVLPLYDEKIDTFLDQIYSLFVTYGKPVMSSFRSSLVIFFLDIHLSYGNHPDYVIEYFTNFIDVVGFGDPRRPGRDKIVMKGYKTLDAIKAYFYERNQIVKSTQDKSCIIYHWHLAGLDTKGLVMEAVHNIVAFSQFNNILYLLVSDRISRSATPTRIVKYDFLKRYRDATTDSKRLNVV